MKIIRVFGIVVGIHLFALMLIFANPGCSSTSKPAPAAADTAPTPAPSAPVVSVPLSGASTSEPSTLSSAPIGFDPTAPAVASVRYSPTRPNTPAATALEAAPVADVTPATTYTILAGDSLWTIAKKNHLTVSELATANNMKAGSALRPGQKLIIPGKTAAPAAATPSPKSSAKVSSEAPAGAKSAGDAIQHTVKPGEALGTIARKYGVKAGDIAIANNITDPAKITAGRVLTIPGWQAPKPKTSGSTAAKPSDQVPTVKTVESPKSLFVIPPIEQDLDSGLKPAPAGEVPVIKVEEAPKK